MTVSTWVALDTVTVANGSTNTIQFSSIPNTYKNLVVVANLRSSDSRTGYQSVSYTFNGTTTGYGATILYGNGTNALSYNQNNAGVFEGLCFMNGGNPNRFYTNTLNIMDYANPSKFKSVLIDMSDSNLGAYKSAGTWRNNSVISSIQITEASNLPWAQGSSATLYGLSAVADEATPKATGGYVYQDSTHWYHAFPFSSTFTPSETLSCDVLVVAGGGGGARRHGGGGGAGGLSWQANRTVTSGAKVVTIGAGGAGSMLPTLNGGPGNNGSNTVFDTITSNGGGGGGGFSSSASNGGSGGGANIGAPPGTLGAFGSATQGNTGGATGYGNRGGYGIESGGYYGGGGGGAGGVGADGNSSNRGGAGGIGIGGNTISVLNAIGAATNFGELSSGNYYFAGGGAGSQFGVSGLGSLGGLGGGGRAIQDNNVTNKIIHGLASTGGGGGARGSGGGSDDLPSGNGGSGLVVIRYAK